MAAPSRSTNYRSGSALEIDTAEYMRLLRSLKGLPKEANQALRQQARDIADEIIKPIIIREILRHAPTVGPTLAQSVRSAGDRVPKVVIGKSRAPYYGNHLIKGTQGPITGKQSVKRPKGKHQMASTNMLRYGTIVGVYKRQSGTADPSGRYKSRGAEVTWPKNVVRPGWTEAAALHYMKPTFDAWQVAVNDIVTTWNKG